MISSARDRGYYVSSNLEPSEIVHEKRRARERSVKEATDDRINKDRDGESVQKRDTHAHSARAHTSCCAPRKKSTLVRRRPWRRGGTLQKVCTHVYGERGEQAEAEQERGGAPSKGEPSCSRIEEASPFEKTVGSTGAAGAARKKTRDDSTELFAAHRGERGSGYLGAHGRVCIMMTRAWRGARRAETRERDGCAARSPHAA